MMTTTAQQIIDDMTETQWWRSHMCGTIDMDVLGSIERRTRGTGTGAETVERVLELLEM